MPPAPLKCPHPPGLNTILMWRATCPSTVRSRRPLTMRAAFTSLSTASATCGAAQGHSHQVEGGERKGWLPKVQVQVVVQSSRHCQQPAQPVGQRRDTAMGQVRRMLHSRLVRRQRNLWGSEGQGACTHKMCEFQMPPGCSSLEARLREQETPKEQSKLVGKHARQIKMC